MSLPTLTTIFIFTMVGGGVHGEGIGTARGTIIQVGATIETFLRFIEGYTRVGGVTTGSIDGKDVHGTTIEYPTIRFIGTGRAGKGIGIGKSNEIGVLRVFAPRRDQSTRHAKWILDSIGQGIERPGLSGHKSLETLKRCNHDSLAHQRERPDRSGHRSV
jgi:hypothetical protein